MSSASTIDKDNDDEPLEVVPAPVVVVVGFVVVAVVASLDEGKVPAVAVEDWRLQLLNRFSVNRMASSRRQTFERCPPSKGVNWRRLVLTKAAVSSSKRRRLQDQSKFHHQLCSDRFHRPTILLQSTLMQPKGPEGQ